MKSPSPILHAALLLCGLWSFPIMADSTEAERALSKGARANITLRVIDQDERPVSGANVFVYFTLADSPENSVSGTTDTGGLFTAEKLCTSTCRWTVSKPNYYATSGSHAFSANVMASTVKNGCWQPWGQTLTVVLKEKREPVSPVVKRIDLEIPAYGTEVGFDLEKGDWLAPHGTGQNAHVFFTLFEEYKDRANQKQELALRFPDNDCGVIREKQDAYSELQTAYAAPLDGYAQTLTLAWEGLAGKKVMDNRLAPDDYLIFRFKTGSDAPNVEPAFRYGTLCGALDFSPGLPNARRLWFTYCLNPQANDRNLEFKKPHVSSISDSTKGITPH